LKEDWPRYFHDSLKVILKGLKGASQQAMAITLDICLENKIYNAYEFGQVLSLQKRMYNPESGYLKMAIRMHPDHFQQGMDPETSNINYYESILK
jgi:hypothetical protein